MGYRLVPNAEPRARRCEVGQSLEWIDTIMVLHDGHHEDPTADRRHTIETVALLIPRLRARGFAFGTICEGNL